MGGQAQPCGLAVLRAQGGSSPDAAGLFEKSKARRDLEKNASVADQDRWTLDRSRDSLINPAKTNRKGTILPLGLSLERSFGLLELV
jgi:hypothetical protein